jgi:hypothetical protein
MTTVDTQGLKVYRHKDRFLVFRHKRAYLEGLGLTVLGEIPQADATPREFKQWLTTTRKMVEEWMEKLEETEDSNWEWSEWTTDEQPGNDLFKWVYELDLDNLVFHIDTMPVFRLDHVPPPALFLQAVGYNHYGHRAVTKNTPKEYWYDSSAPPPPPDHLALKVYKNHAQAGPIPVHQLLSVPESLSVVEHSRIAFLEIIVGHHMASRSTAHLLHVLEKFPFQDSEFIPRRIFSMVLSALQPMVFPSEEIPPADRDWLPSFMWLTHDLCFRMTTRLDDEASLQGAVGQLISRVTISTEFKEKRRVVYGILFSIFHCVIVSIDLSAGGTCRHTSALPFLPSWYASSRSTPGIAALARLGNLLQFEVEPCNIRSVNRDHDRIKIIWSGSGFVLPAKKPTMLSRIPEEICYVILSYLAPKDADSPNALMDLINCASLSPAFNIARWWMWKYPHVDGYRHMKKMTTILSRIPEDVCDMIISYLHMPDDIVICMSLSPAFKSAAMRILKYPHIGGCRLLKPAHQLPLDVPSGGGNADSREFEGDTNLQEYEGDTRYDSDTLLLDMVTNDRFQPRYAFLRSGRFEAVADSGNAVVELGPSSDHKRNWNWGVVRLPLLLSEGWHRREICSLKYTVLREDAAEADRNLGELA